VTTEPDLSTPESARQAAELEAMLRMLSLSSGIFSLSISVCNSPALRDYLIEKMRIARPDIQVIRIPNDTADVLMYVRQQTKAPDCSALFIVGLEELLPSTEARHPVLRSINASRELWERQFHCPIVIWLPEYAAGLLSREAPDFWRYRSHRFEFVSENAHASTGMQEDTSSLIHLASNLSVDEKQFRIAELEQRVEEAGPKPERILMKYIATWLTELAFLQQSMGQFEAAEQIARRLLALNEELGDKLVVATSYRFLGELLRDRGDFEAGEEIARKVLALNEELGDKTRIAASYRLLGELLRGRGDLEGAEQIVRKSLALNEELGDIAGIAADYRLLGTLSLERGDLEAAEQMYRTSLVFYEELDDKDGVARDYALLSRLYVNRGDLEAAELAVHKSLALHEELDNRVGMAHDYGLLGILYLGKGDLEAGERSLAKSRELWRYLGANVQIERLEEVLRGLESSKGSAHPQSSAVTRRRSADRRPK
jgi:tetratricopeptide (TPR) repeat protein